MRLRAGGCRDAPVIGRGVDRKPLTDMELEERPDHSTRTFAVAIENQGIATGHCNEITPGLISGYNGALASSRKRER